MEMNIHFLSVQVSASGATSISAKKKKKSGVAIEVRPSPLENRYVKAALH